MNALADPPDIGSDREVADRKPPPKPSKTVTIVVEGTPHEWPKGEPITYVQVVTLEVPDHAQHPEITYAVKYRKGPAHRPEGVLPPGGAVKVKEGMIFNVSETGQS